MFNLHSQMKKHNEDGFTLVEILVVVVIIGLLALIAIPIYLNQQIAAKNASSQQSLSYLNKAIVEAKTKTGKSLVEITGSTCSACSSFGAYQTQSAAFPQDPATLDKSSPSWVYYTNQLRKISDASGMDVTNLVDGYGRPLVMDENEGEGASCGNDVIGVLKDPLVNWGALEYRISVAKTTKNCI